jgi:hypothetical protein
VQLPLVLEVRRSPGFIAVLCLAHTVAAVGLLPVDLPFVAKSGLWVALAVSLAVLLGRGRRVAAIVLRADGRLSLLGKDRPPLECQVDPATTVLPWLIVLLVKAGEKTVALILPADALGAEGHRQLRVWLKWRANAGQQA